MSIYYCRNEVDYKKAALDIFINNLDYLGAEGALNAAQICVCQYAIESSLNNEDGQEDEQIDSCRNCDIEECLLLKNIDSKDICKNIFIIGLEDEIFPCIVFQDEKDIITSYSIEKAKNNTKYGVKNSYLYSY